MHNREFSSRSLVRTDRMRILERMDVQEAAWNAGDLEGFMAAYWQSDSLLFVGRGAIHEGGRPPWRITAPPTRTDHHGNS